MSGPAVERGALEDVAVALRPQHRQRRPQHVEHAEHVRVEDAPRLLVGRLLDRAEDAVARVLVHEIDASEGLERACHGVLHLGRPSDVHGERKDAIAVLVGKGAKGRDLAGDRDDVVATVGRGAGDFQADSGGGAGDEPGGRSGVGHGGVELWTGRTQIGRRRPPPRP